MGEHDIMNNYENKLGTTQNTDWSKLTPDEKKHLLFEKQKQMLDEFLAHGAIDKKQYDTSLNGLITKMNMN